MSKHLLYFCIILVNLRLFWTHFDLNNGKPFDASNYLKLLSKVNQNQNKNSSEDNIKDNIQKSDKNSLNESVRQMRRFLNPGKEAPTHQCENTVIYFDFILAQFIQCILINDVPFTLCLGCSQQYSDLLNAYSDLTNTSISNCSNSFLTDDKINLIHNFFQNSISKWTEGNCDSCFGLKDGNQNLVVNNDTLYYFELYEEYVSCLQTHNNTNLKNNSCVLCENAFNSVNDFYELITTNYTTRLCIDIIESMKDIRKHWIEALDCPVPYTSSLHFLALVFIIIVLPFVLYIIGKLFCVEKNNKTLMKQKRLSTYHLGSYENEPLIEK